MEPKVKPGAGGATPGQDQSESFGLNTGQHTHTAPLTAVAEEVSGNYSTKFLVGCQVPHGWKVARALSWMRGASAAECRLLEKLCEHLPVIRLKAETIAGKAGVSRRSVPRYCRKWAARGVLTVAGYGNGGRSRPNEYVVNFGRLAQVICESNPQADPRKIAGLLGIKDDKRMTGCHGLEGQNHAKTSTKRMTELHEKDDRVAYAKKLNNKPNSETEEHEGSELHGNSSPTSAGKKPDANGTVSFENQPLAQGSNGEPRADATARPTEAKIDRPAEPSGPNPRVCAGPPSPWFTALDGVASELGHDLGSFDRIKPEHAEAMAALVAKHGMDSIVTAFRAFYASRNGKRTWPHWPISVFLRHGEDYIKAQAEASKDARGKPVYFWEPGDRLIPVRSRAEVTQGMRCERLADKTLIFRNHDISLQYYFSDGGYAAEAIEMSHTPTLDDDDDMAF